ncbi:MAG: hypothetical protein OEZ13_05770 [Spirochaetia bacterium]|nr:hypothetical protein [Spirochaetia bacterium]
MKKTIIITLVLASFFSSCSSQLEIEAVFRGDVPLKFSLTSIEFTEGDTRSMTLSLIKQPSADVTVNLTATDLTEIEIQPSTIFFTPDNYSSPQTIQVMAINDCSADGTANLNISLSSVESTDTEFSSIQNLDIPVTVNDSSDSNPNIIFYAPSEIITSELGTTSFFKAKLSCPPLPDNNVIVPLENSDNAEAVLDKSSILFTSSNYNDYQTVTITGLSDCMLDNDKDYTIRTRNVYTELVTGSVEPLDERFNRYHDTNTMAAGESRRYTSITGKNLNVAVENDLVLNVPIGGMNMELDYLTSHPDEFLSFSLSLSCPIIAPLYFSFMSTGNFAEVINTPSGNNFITFDSGTWSTPQSVLMRLNQTMATEPALLPASPYEISIYESTADNINPQPINPSTYSEKILNVNLYVIQ